MRGLTNIHLPSDVYPILIPFSFSCGPQNLPYNLWPIGRSQNKLKNCLQSLQLHIAKRKYMLVSAASVGIKWCFLLALHSFPSWHLIFMLGTACLPSGFFFGWFGLVFFAEAGEGSISYAGRIPCLVWKACMIQIYVTT